MWEENFFQRSKLVYSSTNCVNKFRFDVIVFKYVHRKLNMFLSLRNYERKMKTTQALFSH